MPYVGYGEPSTSTESLTESLSVVSVCIKYFLSVCHSVNGQRRRQGLHWSSKNIISWSSKNKDQDDAMHDIYTMLYGRIKLQNANPTYLNL